LFFSTKRHILATQGDMPAGCISAQVVQSIQLQQVWL